MAAGTDTTTSGGLTEAEARQLVGDLMQWEQDEALELGRLARTVPVMVRWLARRGPSLFRHQPTLVTDEPGHWDAQYPPRGHTARRTPRRLHVIRAAETSEIPTSHGFYYDWRYETTVPGLAADREGHIYEVVEGGTAHLGAYNAHPGVDHQHLTTEYRPVHGLSLDDWRVMARELEERVRRVHSEAAAA